MERVLFDSHAHYDDTAFDTDRHELLSKLPEIGVKYIMNAACDIESCTHALEFSEKYDYIYAAAGIHPQAADECEKYPDYIDIIAEKLSHDKVKALGEIGLDYHYLDSTKEVQKKVFEAQLKLAKELDVPVIIHDREAHLDTMELLKKYNPKGIVHCYSGSAEMAKEIIKLGMYIGFTGVLTFKNARRSLEAAAVIPQDRLLIETDCPYMAPVPYRGKRCDSSMLFKTAEALAQVKGVSLDDMCRITCENACRVYGIER